MGNEASNGPNEHVQTPELPKETRELLPSVAKNIASSKALEASNGSQETDALKYLAGYHEIGKYIDTSSEGTISTRDGFGVKDPNSRIQVDLVIPSGGIKHEIRGRVTGLGQPFPKEGYILVQITDSKGVVCKIPDKDGKLTDKIPLPISRLLDGQMLLVLDEDDSPLSDQEKKALQASIALANGEGVKPEYILNKSELKALCEKTGMVTTDKAMQKAKQLIEKLTKNPGPKPEEADGQDESAHAKAVAEWTGVNQKWEALGPAEQARIDEMNQLMSEIAQSDEILVDPANFGRLLALGHKPSIEASMSQLKGQIALMEQSMRESLSVGDQAAAKRMRDKLDELRDEQKVRSETLQNFESNTVALIKQVNAGEIIRGVKNADGTPNPDPTELMEKFINTQSESVIEDLKKIDGAMMLKKTMELLKDNKSEAIKSFFERYKPYILAGGAFALIAFKIIEYALQKSEKA